MANKWDKVSKKRYNLWLQNPFCHWCEVETLLEIDYIKLDNFATIDHIFHKGHPKRKKNRKKVVLACQACNRDRNEIFKTIYRESCKIPDREILIKKMIHANDPNDIDAMILRYYRENRKVIDKIYDAKT